MRTLQTEDLSGKMVLEVGTGRGSTTRELVETLSVYSNSRLITTDIQDRSFDRLREEFEDTGVPVEFIRTDACELVGIQDGTMDYVVCNYTLCAINARPGAAVLALRRFKEVLRDGGVLYIKEEFPIGNPANKRQEIWSKKWQITLRIKYLASLNHLSQIDQPGKGSALIRKVKEATKEDNVL